MSHGAKFFLEVLKKVLSGPLPHRSLGLQAACHNGPSMVPKISGRSIEINVGARKKNVTFSQKASVQRHSPATVPISSGKKKPHSSGGYEPWGETFFGGFEEGCAGPAATRVLGSPGVCHNGPSMVPKISDRSGEINVGARKKNVALSGRMTVRLHSCPIPRWSGTLLDDPPPRSLHIGGRDPDRLLAPVAGNQNVHLRLILPLAV